MINPNKKFTRTDYIACHGKDHGAGFFSDMKFDTAEQAQTYIDTRAAKVDAEHKEYWTDIRNHMFILKRESKYTPVESIKILPTNQVKNILEAHTNLNLKDADNDTLLTIINTVKIMQIDKPDRDIISKFADMMEGK